MGEMTKAIDEIGATRERASALMLEQAKAIDPSIAAWIDESLKTQSAICTLEMLQAAVAESRRKNARTSLKNQEG